jgi:surface protein
LSAASLNMVVVSMPRLYDRPAIQDFVMTLDTTLSDDNTVVLPLNGTFDVTVNWGDDTSVETFTSDGDTSPSHVYENEGTYIIRISGSLEHFGMDYTIDEVPWFGVNMVTTVTSFGTLGIESLEGAFWDAENLIQVPTELPTSVTDLKAMFLLADLFNQDIGGWDVSNVTDMSYMFGAASVFNQDLNSWDVSNVTDMSLMFFGADAFNQDIGAWDVGNVNSMILMFAFADAFNQDLENWDVSEATNTGSMFVGSGVAEEDLPTWYATVG